MSLPHDPTQQLLQQEEQQKQAEQQQQEICCSRFEPVTVLGREGVIVLTAKRLLFASNSRSKSSNGNSNNSGISSNEVGNTSNCWEVLLQFALASWTSTERSKKAAKARMTYVAPAAAATAAAADGGLSTQSVVVDFMGLRDKMDLCCRSLQTLASAARTLQGSSSLVCPLDVPLLLQLLQLPSGTPLRVAPALQQQQDLLKKQLKQQQQEQQQDQREQQAKGGSTASGTDVTPAAGAPAKQQHQQHKQPQQNPAGAPQRAAGQKAAAATTAAGAAAAGATGACESGLSSVAAAGAAAAPEVPSLEKLLQQQRYQEAEQLQQFQQRLLQQDPELLALYQTLVGAPEGVPGSSNGSSSNNNKGLSPAEFWKLHQQQLQALKPQLAPEGVSACFLLRPPQFHELQGQQGGAGGGGEAELVVDCSEQMLQQILNENSAVQRAYTSLVDTGRMSADRFWGRLFRSRYFQCGIGLSERKRDAGTAEPSCFIASFVKEKPVSSREALCLPGIERTLLSDADLRVRGFGLPDGLSSLAGDLAEKPPPAAVVAAAAAASAGPEAEAEAAAAASSSSSLVGRFNKHSQRLLLQQLLQPAAAAAAINDEAGHEQKLHLLLQQEEHQRKRRSVRPEPAGAVLQANLKDAATIGCGVLEEEAPVLESLRLEELEEAAPAKYQTLEVSRRQLYAAGARVGCKSVSSNSGAVAASCEASAAAEVKDFPAPEAATAVAAAAAGAAEEAERVQEAVEAEAADSWLLMERQRTAERSKGSPQTAEDAAAVFNTGRFMFVFNTKLCQKDKAAQFSTLDYEAATVNAVRAQQARVGELLRHFYSTTLPEEKKRSRLIQALDAIKAELENSQDISGGFTGAATKALSTPLVEQITAARRHANRLQRLLQAAREKRISQHVRQAQQQAHPQHTAAP